MGNIGVKPFNPDEDPRLREKTNPLPDLLCPGFGGHIYIYIHTDTHDHYFYGWVDFFKSRENTKNDENR